jgi:hypothetical protein
MSTKFVRLKSSSWTASWCTLAMRVVHGRPTQQSQGALSRPLLCEALCHGADLHLQHPPFQSMPPIGKMRQSHVVNSVLPRVRWEHAPSCNTDSNPGCCCMTPVGGKGPLRCCPSGRRSSAASSWCIHSFRRRRTCRHQQPPRLSHRRRLPWAPGTCSSSSMATCRCQCVSHM